MVREMGEHAIKVFSQTPPANIEVMLYVSLTGAQCALLFKQKKYVRLQNVQWKEMKMSKDKLNTHSTHT